MAFNAFQDDAFQTNAFQTGQEITSTAIVQLPVDFWLAGEPPFTERFNTFEGGPRRISKKTVAKKSGVSVLAGKSSFTVTTNARGF